MLVMARYILGQHSQNRDSGLVSLVIGQCQDQATQQDPTLHSRSQIDRHTAKQVVIMAADISPPL